MNNDEIDFQKIIDVLAKGGFDNTPSLKGGFEDIKSLRSFLPDETLTDEELETFAKQFVDDANRQATLDHVRQLITPLIKVEEDNRMSNSNLVYLLASGIIAGLIIAYAINKKNQTAETASAKPKKTTENLPAVNRDWKLQLVIFADRCPRELKTDDTLELKELHNFINKARYFRCQSNAVSFDGSEKIDWSSSGNVILSFSLVANPVVTTQEPSLVDNVTRAAAKSTIETPDQAKNEINLRRLLANANNIKVEGVISYADSPKSLTNNGFLEV